jgi:SAM-dependent methyltransferase
MSDHVPYELSAMALARNFYDWLGRTFGPHLRGTVVEHGAGTGLMSERVRARHSGPLILVEPEAALQELLRSRLGGPETEIFGGTIEAMQQERGDAAVDAILSVNVLEHVPDDVGCLHAMAGLLKPGGALCLYVPARPELFGSLDDLFTHCRRYDRGDLVGKIEAAGLRVERADYRNLIGAAGWWFTGKVLRRRLLDFGVVRFYDRFVFPPTSQIEDRFPPPYGQNLLVIARKP